jgi:ABC-2 type transport system permease protein
MCVVLGVPLARVLGGAPPSWWSLTLVVPSLVLAITCNLVAQHAFAGVSFWVRDARATWFLYQKLVFIVGGMLLPLEVLPAAMTKVALWLPFMAMAYAPSRLASGHAEPWLLARQGFWLVALSGLAVAVFARGERRLQVVGG